MTEERTHRLDVSVSPTVRRRLEMAKTLIAMDRTDLGVITWSDVVEFLVTICPVEKLLIARLSPGEQNEGNSDGK